MSDELRVDPAALDSFAACLDTIKNNLYATRPWLDDCSGALGPGQLESALDAFDANWRDGRTEIDGGLASLSATARAAASAFRDVDNGLAGGS
jgi:hypothetical protein